MSTFKKMQKTFILWVWLFSPARIQPSLWLISLINCIPSISARKQSMASAMFGNYHIAILVLQLGNWGTDQGWLCGPGQASKKLFQRFWAAWGQMCSFPAAGARWALSLRWKWGYRSELLWPCGLCHNELCLQGERTRGVNVNWWQKSTLLRRRATCLRQASGRCCWSDGRQAVVPSNKLALCGCHLSISDRNPILQFLIGGIQRSRI